MTVIVHVKNNIALTSNIIPKEMIKNKTYFGNKITLNVQIWKEKL